MDLTPDVKAALLAEIEKALPRLLKRAMAAAETRAASNASTGGVPKPKRKRLRDGLPKIAIMKAVRAYPEEGASRRQIQSIAPNFLGGAKLGDNTLKRWLFVLKKEGDIENINGRWFWQPDAANYLLRSRDKRRTEDDYQEKDDL